MPGKSSTESSDVPGLSRPPTGNARLSVPLAELMIHSVEGMKSLCDDVTVVGGASTSHSSKREGLGMEGKLTIQNLDVCETYSSYKCVETIISYLPLLNHLFSLVVASFKKIQNHVSVQRGDNNTFPVIIFQW